MTTQFPDTVIYNGETYHTESFRCGDLFAPYLEKHHIKLFANCSALWRGYIAKWKIENNMLFLTDIRANVHEFKENANNADDKTFDLLEGYVGLDYFFPSNDKMIFADWVSGCLPILYKHEASGAELYLIFKIDKGHVISQKHQTYEEYYGHPYVEENYDDLPF